MKFPIIIPTYNRAEFISKTIGAVLNQTYVYFEIIVVGDGSRDNTEEIVLSAKDDRIRYYKKKNESLKYYLKTLKKNPFFIFTKRNLAIIKHFAI